MLRKFSNIFGHHQDDQEGPKSPQTGDLEDLGHLDGNFVIVTTHMITFWNSWDHGSVQEVFLAFLVIRMTKTWDLEDLGHLNMDFVIETLHIITFQNPWDHGSVSRIC